MNNPAVTLSTATLDRFRRAALTLRIQDDLDLIGVDDPLTDLTIETNVEIIRQKQIAKQYRDIAFIGRYKILIEFDTN